MQTIDNALKKLSKSKFRSSFHLKAKDIAYIDDLTKKYKEYCNEKGLDVIEQHARDFISKRIAPAVILNDGKQTPMKNHPVFIAQHACACCCRSCLEKWYKVPQGKALTKTQQEKIVKLLMAWIEKEYTNAKS